MAAARVWRKADGEAALGEMVKQMKVGLRRTLYNKIETSRRLLDSTRSSLAGQSLQRQAAVLGDLKRGVETTRSEVTAMLSQHAIYFDPALPAVAARMFDEIKIEDTQYVGIIESLNIKHKDAQYRVGKMVLTYPRGQRRTLGSNRIKVTNLDLPAGAEVQHPHVNSHGQVCFGTWRDMITTLCQEEYHWLRVFTLTGEFLTHYSPEGGPYRRLLPLWGGRHVGGVTLCPRCEVDAQTCGCARATSGMLCPKNMERRPSLPERGYCDGCGRWVTGTMLGNPENLGLCAGDISADTWIERNIGPEQRAQVRTGDVRFLRPILTANPIEASNAIPVVDVPLVASTAILTEQSFVALDDGRVAIMQRPTRTLSYPYFVASVNYEVLSSGISAAIRRQRFCEFNGTVGASSVLRITSRLRVLPSAYLNPEPETYARMFQQAGPQGVIAIWPQQEVFLLGVREISNDGGVATTTARPIPEGLRSGESVSLYVNRHGLVCDTPLGNATALFSVSRYFPVQNSMVPYYMRRSGLETPTTAEVEV